MATVKLNAGEIGHLLTLIADNENEGNYWGNRAHWVTRRERVKLKLRAAIDAEEASPEPPQ